MEENENVTPPTAATPSNEVLQEVRAYYELLQVEYANRLAEAEQFLGFAVGTEALGTRLAKLEQFLGIKG